MRALGPSLKRSLVDQNKVKPLNKFCIQLIFPFHGVRIRRADLLFQLIPRLAEQLNVKLRVTQDVGDQSLVGSSLLDVQNKSYYKKLVVKS